MKYNLITRLFLKRIYLLLKIGVFLGKVQLFEEDVYDKLKGFYFNGIPLSIHIKYLKPIMGPGKCYDRSLLLSFGFEHPTLIQADMKDLELKYGKDSAWHYFIESNGYVYDPTMLLKIDKRLYYLMRKPKNMQSWSDKELKAIPLIENIKKTSINDLRTSLEQRANLLCVVPLIQEIVNDSNNDSFQKEYHDFLVDIQYDFESISKEVDNAIYELLSKSV
ncbi:MAG: hypothetical protein Q4D02_04135 [Clostridia bacterium]|nr:hypothetical protein [Clostridia bacterium]